MFNRGTIRENTRRGAGNARVIIIRVLCSLNVIVLPGTQEKQK